MGIIVYEMGHEWEQAKSGHWWCKRCEICGGNRKEPDNVGFCPRYRVEPMNQYNREPIEPKANEDAD